MSAPEAELMVHAYLRDRDEAPIRAAAPALQADAVVALFMQVSPHFARQRHATAFMCSLFGQRLPYELADGVSVVSRLVSVLTAEDCPLVQALDMVDQVLEVHGRDAALLDALERLHEVLEIHKAPYVGGEYRRADNRVERMLCGTSRGLPHPVDGWGNAALAHFESLADRTAWLALYQYAAETSGNKPSARWLKAARARLEAVGEEALRTQLEAWLPEFAQAAPRSERGAQPAIGDDNAELLKGLVWVTLLMPDEHTASCIGRLGEACFRKSLDNRSRGPQLPRSHPAPGNGVVSAKVGKACIHVLGTLEGTHGVAWLARLMARVKHKEAQRLIAKALDEAAKRTGNPCADIEELCLPSFGLGTDGSARWPMGASVAIVRVTGTADAELLWDKGDGREQKAAPAEVLRDHAEELKELKASFKDLTKLLPALSARIQRQLRVPRWLRQVDFRERYLEHGLVAPLTRRLLWTVETSGTARVCGVLEGQLVGADDCPVELAPEAKVALWQPMGASDEEVRAWRSWLVRHGITQPFEQAHLLTEAERATSVPENANRKVSAHEPPTPP